MREPDCNFIREPPWPDREAEKAKKIELNAFTFGPYHLATACRTDQAKRHDDKTPRQGKEKKVPVAGMES